jgi:modulator of FtsH protease HflK
MAWNEPGNGGGNNNPWGGRNESEPPDLDEVIKKIQGRLNGLFGGGNGTGSSGPGSSGAAGTGWLLGIVAVMVVWLLSGIYIIDPAERGVELRFGHYSATTTPGPHWHYPWPIESVEVVNVDQNRNAEVGYRSGRRAMSRVSHESLMLTQDENIVDIQFAVQYKVKSAKDYLFNVQDPDTTLRQATESAIREVVGKNKMTFVLTEGRSQVSEATRDLIQNVLDRYGTGLQLTSVNMQDAQPPEEVQSAFADAVKAREDEQRLINEAETYSNDILPKSRGAAARQMQEANAYRDQVIARSEGEADRFSKVLVAYEKAPKVTRQRLYLESLESVLQKSSKVIIDVDNGNPLLFLPLDQMLNKNGRQNATPSLTQLPRSSAESMATGKNSSRIRESRARDHLRLREGR